MNTAGINLGSLNGGQSVKWVISATAIAFAGLTSSVNASRLCSGNVYGDARANVTLSTTNTVAARASGLCDVNSSVIPTIIRTASSYALADSFGSSSVWRNIAGSASADGTAYGEGIASDHLGESGGSAMSDGVGTPHIVFSGKVNILAEAIGTADSIAIRGTTVLGIAGSSGFGEASIQKSGESFIRLDGYAKEDGMSSGFVRNDYTATIATNGSFVVSTSYGLCTPYITHPGKVSAVSTATGESSALRTTTSFSLGIAESVGFVADIRIKYGESLGVGAFDVFQAKAQVKYMARGSDTAGSYSVVATPKIIHRGKATGVAEATSNAPVHATHRFAVALSSSQANSIVGIPLITRNGLVNALATSTGTSVYAAQYFAASSDVGNSTGLVESSNINFASSASGNAVSVGFSECANQYWATANNDLSTSCDAVSASINFAASAVGSTESYGNSSYAEHHFGTAQGVTECVVTPVIGRYVRNAYATNLSEAFGIAIGFSNADVHAPETRAMIAPFEDRMMIAPKENRTMVVEA